MNGDASVSCWACGEETPRGAYCVRCGADLHRRQEPSRRGFAAAPNERKLVPRVTSTLFPRLPQAAMSGFRLALLVAVAAVIGLTLADAFSLAIVVAAVSVPTLGVIYLYDVDVYEDQPLVVVALTVLWGAAMGIGVALLGQALAPSDAELLGQSTRETVVQQGIVLPLTGLLLALLGPLVLLPYRRFNDALDGVTFGAISAAWLVATQLLVQSRSLFDDGVRPGGMTDTWILRLLQLAVTTPLVWASVGGAVAGAFWVRYRTAPHFRGVAGRPVPALVLGGSLVVLTALAQILLPLWAALVVSTALAALSLLWLRQLIHLGLVEEARERDVDADIVCANCGDRTPRHTYCSSCGIALAALPKGHGPDGDGYVPGSEPARLRNRVVLAVFGLVLLVIGAVSSGVLATLAPASTQTCFPGEPCGGPPSTSPRLVAGTVWRSPGGVALEYDPARWDVERKDDDVLILVSDDRMGRVEVSVEGGRNGVEASEPSLPRWLKSPKEVGLPVPHGPNVGYVNGSGTWHEGLLDAPQGPRQTINVATLSSTHGGSAVAVSALFFGSTQETFAAGRLRAEIDTILNTVAWRESPDGQADASSTGVPARGLRPADVARAYGIAPLWDAGVLGQGETIALVSLDTFRKRDIVAYERLMGIADAAPLRRIRVDGPVPLGPGALEVSLDIEVIRAVAPEATILDYEARATWPGFVAALKRINDDGRARIVSVSWGKCLPAVEGEIVEAMERELDRARRAGTTIFVASGDAGAFSCLHSESELDPDQHRAAVDWPAGSPSVVAVGGTRLSLRGDGSYYAENGWEDTLSSDGSGGGVNPLHERPAWQRREAVPRGTDRRQVPDVAGPADCDSAFFIVYPEWSDGKWVQRRGPHGCGTSAAAPFWAGVAALVTQYARQHGVERLGFLGTVLYALPRRDPRTSPLHDVRTGGNLLGDAGPGWDYATGLGSPHAWNLARALVAALERVNR